jgi:hypothetical protein
MGEERGVRVGLAVVLLLFLGCKRAEKSVIERSDGADSGTAANAATGIPASGAGAAATVATRAPLRGEALIVSMDHPELAVVGDSFHLNCSYDWSGSPSRYVPEQGSLVWYSDPPDALGFATRSYTLPLRPGPVRIWATYPGDKRLDAGTLPIRSNTFELVVAPGRNATPVAIWLADYGYTLLLRDDGVVDYIGVSHVKVKGIQSDRISAEALQKLLDEADAAGFASYRGGEPQMDAPSTVLAVRSKGSAHAALFVGAPEPLHRLVRDIKQTVNVERWAGEPGKFTDDDGPLAGVTLRALMGTDLNTASEGELLLALGLSDADVKKIIANRPYASKEELVSKKVLSRATYLKIRNHVTVGEK